MIANGTAVAAPPAIIRTAQQRVPSAAPPRTPQLTPRPTSAILAAAHLSRSSRSRSSPRRLRRAGRQPLTSPFGRRPSMDDERGQQHRGVGAQHGQGLGLGMAELQAPRLAEEMRLRQRCRRCDACSDQPRSVHPRNRAPAAEGQRQSRPAKPSAAPTTAPHCMATSAVTARKVTTSSTSLLAVVGARTRSVTVGRAMRTPSDPPPTAPQPSPRRISRSGFHLVAASLRSLSKDGVGAAVVSEAVPARGRRRPAAAR